MEILNRVARHNYFIDDEIEAGIALTGTEIKAIREGNCNIKDSYGIIRNREVILLNMFIGEYKQGNIFNHKSTRNRKLLLHKREILKLNDKIRLEGYTLIPLKVYFNKDNRAKVLLGVCKGKKDYDKRESIKERDIKRHTMKVLKERY